jgi:hypothetical protein
MNRDFKIEFKSSETEEKIKLNSQEILNFYKENSNIGFQEANLLLINIFNFCKSNENISLMNYNCVENNSLVKNIDMEFILNKQFPSDIIVKNNDETIFYSYSIYRNNKPKMLISNNDCLNNISCENVNKFLITCEENGSNGILLSNNSGIIGKKNFEIELINSIIIIYIHFSNFDIEKINLAIFVIDKLSSLITIQEVNLNIPKDILLDINKDFRYFIEQKQELQYYIKECNKNILNQLENLKLKNLKTYLDTKFPKNINIGIYKCELCNLYSSNTLKGIAAHKRGCKKKSNFLFTI